MSWWDAYRFKMLTPIVVGAILMTFSYLNSLRKSRRSQNARTGFDIRILVASFTSFVLFVVIAVYSFLASVALSPFNCRLVGQNKYVLSAAVQISCYDEEWKSHVPEAIFFLTLYFVVCPVAVVSILYFFNRFRRLNTAFQRILYRHAFISLTQPYRDRMFYWELLTTLKRLLFVFCSTLFDSLGYVAKILLTIMMLFAFAWLESITIPYTRRNWAKISWNFVLILVLLSQGLMFEIKKTDPNSVGDVGITILVVLVFLIIITCLVTNVYNILKDRILKCTKLDDMMSAKIRIPASMFYNLNHQDMKDIAISYNEEYLKYRGYLKLDMRVLELCLSDSAWGELQKHQDDFSAVPGHKRDKGATTEAFDGASINLPDIISIPTVPLKERPQSPATGSATFVETPKQTASAGSPRSPSAGQRGTRTSTGFSLDLNLSNKL
jgi:hypothetical protein